MSNSSNAPGLGFDYSDFFAMHPNIQELDRNHDRNGNALGFAFFSPFGLYGSPMYYPSDTSAPDQSQVETQEPQPQPQQQPQIVIVMPPNYQPDGRNPSPAQPAQSAAPDATPAISEYVLMRRDGGLVFANAFTVQNGEIMYITAEGNLRKIKLADLDLDATRKMNEERGTVISLPGENSSR